MSEWTSLSCKEPTKERLQELQGDESQDEVLNRALDALEARKDGPTTEMTAKVNVDTDEAMEKLDEMDERIKDMDVVSRNQQVIKRIDDLETELKTHLERELRQ